MAKEIDARQLLDESGNVYFPFTHVSCVDGIPDDFADLDLGSVSDLQVTVDDLQKVVNSIPVFDSTGWLDIGYLNGTESFDAGTRPQVQLMTIGDVRFMSLRGAFKGLTKDQMKIGELPSGIVWAITKNVYFSQAITTSGGKSQFSTMKLSVNGVISVEETTTNEVTAGNWFPIDMTIML